MQQLKKSLLSLIILILYFVTAIPLTVFSANSEGKPCKNYVDCKYDEGYFCVNSNCKKVCSGGKVSGGVDLKGVSLPCEGDYTFSGFNDKSGRKICCPEKSKKEQVESVTQSKVLGMLCKETKDCKEGEFCSYTESNISRCGLFNCDGSYISRVKCSVEDIFLAEGPEGYFCCPLIFLGRSSSSSSSGATSSSSSSSGGMSSSSSSGGNKPSSSSGGIKDYNVQIVLQTPEIVTSKNLSDNISLLQVASAFGKSSSGSTPAAAPSIETHNYKAGEKLSFSIYVKGPSLSKPKDVSSYTLAVIANEKDSSNLSPSLKILELAVNDIIACTDLKSFLSNPIPLNVALIKQDSKGAFNAVNGDTFTLQLPDTRYLASTSGRIVLASPDTQLKSIPENKCSPAADKVCGVDNISVSNCISYSCWKYSKGSPFSKECCRGTLPENTQDELPTSSSSGAAPIPVPICNKTSKEIECKTTNKFLVPYCSNRNIPGCDATGKPVCNELSSSGKISLEEPACVLYSDSTENYCKDISSLLYANGFDPASCVNNFCSQLKSTEEKRICCTACGVLYDKTKNPNIMLEEIDQMKSCLDFNGGLCGSIKQSQSCIEGGCYKNVANSDDMKICCSQFDKNGSVIKALLKEGRLEEDKGMIYNLIGLGGGSIKIQKSSEDIIAQNFELLLPSDPSIESVTLRASIKDKKGKVKDSNVKILLFNKEKEDENLQQLEGSMDNKQTCNPPEISSLRVTDKARIFAVIGNSVEIPIFANDKDNDIVSLKVTGLPPSLRVEDVTKVPGYFYSQIKGSIKTKGKYSISAVCTDKCGKTSSLNFEIYVSNPGEQVPENLGQTNILPTSSPSVNLNEKKP